MKKEDKELLQMQTAILNLIKETHYNDNTFQEFSDNAPASQEVLDRINLLFFNYLRDNGHPEIYDFLDEFKFSLLKLNEYAYQNNYTARKMIKLLHTKYLAVVGYMVDSNLDEKLDKKVIADLIESTSKN
tara:strand:+ start:178 stop:567 length:390 start_codon:yes stop_codon:yes gene_type:complete